MKKINFVLLFSAFLFSYPFYSFAQLSGVSSVQNIGKPFGGRSRSVVYCSCTPGCFKVEVGPPKGGTFMYCVWGTRLYAHYNIYPNAWQLGLGGDYIACLQYDGDECEYDGGGPLMKINGTSHGGGVNIGGFN